MGRRKGRLGQTDKEAEMLEKERFAIERRFIELDDAILHGQGSLRILEAAKTLVHFLQVHFTHEEQFRKQISFPVAEDPRAVWQKNMAELLQIEAGLRQGEVYSALRLRSFCRGWIHMQRMWTSIFQASLAPKKDRAQA